MNKIKDCLEFKDYVLSKDKYAIDTKEYDSNNFNKLSLSDNDINKNSHKPFFITRKIKTVKSKV